MAIDRFLNVCCVVHAARVDGVAALESNDDATPVVSAVPFAEPVPKLAVPTLLIDQYADTEARHWRAREIVDAVGAFDVTCTSRCCAHCTPSKENDPRRNSIWPTRSPFVSTRPQARAASSLRRITADEQC